MPLAIAVPFRETDPPAIFDRHETRVLLRLARQYAGAAGVAKRRVERHRVTGRSNWTNRSFFLDHEAGHAALLRTGCRWRIQSFLAAGAARRQQRRAKDGGSPWETNDSPERIHAAR